MIQFMFRNELVGESKLESQAVSLFSSADKLDRAGTANQNVVKMFFTAAKLFEGKCFCINRYSYDQGVYFDFHGTNVFEELCWKFSGISGFQCYSVS